MAHTEKRLSLKLLDERLTELEKKVDNLPERRVMSGTLSIQRTERFNNEEPAQQKEDRNLRMSYDDKLVSAKNACKILPPNLTVDGRHVSENISAICGFLVDSEMIDEIYKD